MTLQVDATVDLDGWSLPLRFTASPGEVVGLAGGVGAGKSTALRLVAGLIEASSGTVRFDGEVWDDPGAAMFVTPSARPVGFVRQRPELIDRQPARDQVGGHTELLAELGLASAVVERDGWTLSRGETQRVALAAAIGPEPTVLLLDDPFAALDSVTGRLVRDWLAGRLAARTGLTLLAASDPADLDRFATRIVTVGG